MDLYFVRHGVAAERGTEEFAEEERPLTQPGREKMARAAQGLRRLRVEPQVILSSPLTRALQTAEVIQEELTSKGEERIPLEVEKTLVPGGRLEDFLKKLRNRKETSVMLVGHEPTMSSWVQDLLGCDPMGSILLKKGSLCHLNLTWAGNRAIVELVALLQPRMLRQIG